MKKSIRRKTPLITFMSDFGTRDGYSGAVKGALKTVAPAAEIIDITHDIPAYDINKAAFTLATYYRTFPAGTIHLCVVDPGVGGARAAIIGVTESYYFVGPDNGLFDLVFRRERAKLYEIPMKNHPQISSVFHGRDVFAPVAAQLAKGIQAEEIAVEIEPVNRRSAASFTREGAVLSLAPLTSDRFGNLIFGITKEDLEVYKIVRIQFKKYTFERIQQYYQQAGERQALCLWNSMGFLEIAVNQGNAVELTQADLSKDKLHITVETV